jgi:Zn-dependent metalloprotease
VKKIFSLIAVIALGISFFSLIPLRASAGSGDKSDARQDLKQAALDVLKGRMAARGIAETDDVSVRKIKVDELGMGHVRVRQTVNGIPIWGAEAIVHFNKDGSVFDVTDDMVSGVAINTDANLSKAEAVQIAIRESGLGRVVTAVTNADQWIFRGEYRDHLVYRVQMERFDGSKETGMPVYFIDAQTGEVVFRYDDFQTVTATGASQYSGTVTFETVLSGGSYYLEDLSRKIGTFDYRNRTSNFAPTTRFSDANNVWGGGTQTAAVDAHWGAVKVYDYFQTNFGRNGISGTGGPLVSSSITGTTNLITSGVHYGRKYVNAGWRGSYMIYGDGDGVNSSALTTLDICGHEFTHGVTDYEADLIYSGQSGALNEATSDVFGAMIEAYAKGGVGPNTWKIGEECWTPAIAGDALRYMDNPHQASNSGYTADDDPDHYSERYTGTGDNGGVHINSGIANKAFYLMVTGGSHHLTGTMSAGIGAEKASAIWYKALSDYMTTSTNFAGAKTAMINAANALYPGGSEATIVAEAWTKVGV